MAACADSAVELTVLHGNLTEETQNMERADTISPSKIPPIDAKAPIRTESATFALG